MLESEASDVGPELAAELTRARAAVHLRRGRSEAALAAVDEALEQLASGPVDYPGFAEMERDELEAMRQEALRALPTRLPTENVPGNVSSL